MEQFLTASAVLGIITWGICRIFELVVCRKERMTIIEKLGEKLLESNETDKQFYLPIFKSRSFSALKFGCLLAGMGLGVLVAFFIHYIFSDFCAQYGRIRETIYVACTLLFGGIGLLIAFCIEQKISKSRP